MSDDDRGMQWHAEVGQHEDDHARKIAAKWPGVKSWPGKENYRSALTCDESNSKGKIMGFIAADSGGNFKRVPQGVHIGRCYSLIDLGTQHTSGQYGDKMQHKIRIGWELFGEDENGEPLTIDVDGKQMPLTISKSYTVSLHEKASLRKDLAAWRGRDFTEDEAKAFDVSKLIGAYGMINVTISETNGKTYSNIAGLTPIPSALKNAKPAAVHAHVIFDLDKPDMAVFNTFHEKLKDAIRKSPEWAQKTGKKYEAPTTGEELDDGEIPF